MNTYNIENFSATIPLKKQKKNTSPNKLHQKSQSSNISPWYNRHGWLGVKNQLSIYLSIKHFQISSKPDKCSVSMSTNKRPHMLVTLWSQCTSLQITSVTHSYWANCTSLHYRLLKTYLTRVAKWESWRVPEYGHFLGKSSERGGEGGGGGVGSTLEHSAFDLGCFEE